MDADSIKLMIPSDYGSKIVMHPQEGSGNAQIRTGIHGQLIADMMLKAMCIAFVLLAGVNIQTLQGPKQGTSS